MYPLDLLQWSLAGAAAIMAIGIAVAVALVALARAFVVIHWSLRSHPDNEIGQGMAAMGESLAEGAAGASRGLVKHLDSVQ